MKYLSSITLLFLTACAHFTPDPDVKEKIKKYNLGGVWTYNSSTMSIYCGGAFELDDAKTYTNLSGSGKEKGGFIKSITESKIVTGPLIGRELKIQKLPYQIKKPKEATYNSWYFEIDGRRWTTKRPYNCAREF